MQGPFMYKILLQGENNDRQILLEGLINYSSACVVAFSQTHTNGDVESMLRHICGRE